MLLDEPCPRVVVVLQQELCFGRGPLLADREHLHAMVSRLVFVLCSHPWLCYGVVP